MACVSGMICARGAAAMVTEILSLAISVGLLHPTTASLAVHGVMRSICARTMPSRNSDARRGNSSARKKNCSGRIASSTWLPFNAAAVSPEQLATPFEILHRRE